MNGCGSQVMRKRGKFRGHLTAGKRMAGLGRKEHGLREQGLETGTDRETNVEGWE